MLRTVASPPFSQMLNKDSLVKVRGDLFAGEIKKEKPEAVSIMVRCSAYQCLRGMGVPGMLGV